MNILMSNDVFMQINNNARFMKNILIFEEVGVSGFLFIRII